MVAETAPAYLVLPGIVRRASERLSEEARTDTMLVI